MLAVQSKSEHVLSNHANISDYYVTFTIPEDPFLLRHLFKAFEYGVGARRNAGFFHKVHARAPTSREVWGILLEYQGMTVTMEQKDGARLPADGATVFVANHPSGFPDAAILGHLLHDHLRRDFTFLAIEPMARLPFLRDHVIPIELPSAFGRCRPGKRRSLAQSFGQARDCLGRGEALVIFPSGPGTRRMTDGSYRDGSWQRAAFDLAIHCEAQVVPVFIDYTMSRLRRFMLALHPILYHATAAYEVGATRGKQASVVFGAPIEADELKAIASVRDLPAYMQDLTYGLTANVQAVAG